jgi:hypothetical protein
MNVVVLFCLVSGMNMFMRPVFAFMLMCVHMGVSDMLMLVKMLMNMFVDMLMSMLMYVRQLTM